MALTNPLFKTKLVSKKREPDGRRREEEEEEEKKKRREEESQAKKVWKLLWVWILYGSYGMLRLCMVNILFP